MPEVPRRARIAGDGRGDDERDRDDAPAALEVGVGLDVGPAFVGTVAKAGEIVMSAEVARTAEVTDGDTVMLDLKGKSEPFAAYVVRT